MRLKTAAFFTSSFSRSSWSLSAQATAVFRKSSLSEQFEPQYVPAMEAHPEQREFAYTDSLQQPLPSFIEASEDLFYLAPLY